ncbi:DUF475 domain-containing protein [Beggiatoa leptomitoformis]|uniref:DUF475 domain-containing protein n=1 Tax=Beggiatoa leptomitoformis TaxID=288004 RepID=A0A2N9YAT5_9GAMM|nr:DUF475 domain-containing protein [Beggiatoa leptomitoformis]ALG67061.1 DUF475 domain-containing protein [Beggiatoa leptomitoformis]AUI67554.1 DUF475 domain-containing protein [Beggiatoa leptomitoformis]
MDNLKYFNSSFWVTGIGLILGLVLGYLYTNTITGALSTLFIVAILAVLEVSLSFDNAVVNAKVLNNMTDIWRHRFITWGMLIAVFGMRLVFPLLIVGITAHLNPFATLHLAIFDPDKYAEILTAARIQISGFGGAFLAMVALKYFFDKEKEIHWVKIIEEPLTKVGRIEAVELGLVMFLMYMISTSMPAHEAHEFIVAGIFGLITYILVDGVGALMEIDEKDIESMHKASAAMFVYLEVLDASFSFDGVIGAFALTNNIFVIMIGLGIGAMFVRSLTIMLVEKGTLAEYRYLEHGAFYAIAVLAVIMLTEELFHIPEVVTGLAGAVLIALAIWSSIQWNRKKAVE